MSINVSNLLPLYVGNLPNKLTKPTRKIYVSISFYFLNIVFLWLQSSKLSTFFNYKQLENENTSSDKRTPNIIVYIIKNKLVGIFNLV